MMVRPAIYGTCEHTKWVLDGRNLHQISCANPAVIHLEIGSGSPVALCLWHTAQLDLHLQKVLAARHINVKYDPDPDHYEIFEDDGELD